MITTPLPPALRRAPLRAGVGVLAFVLAASPVSFAQSQATPPASSANAPSAQPPSPSAAPAQAAPAQASPAQAAPPQPAAGAQKRTGRASSTAAAQPVNPPAAAVGVEQTRGSLEAEAAQRDMQAELEPKPGGLTANEVIKQAFEFSPALAKADLEANKAAANEARAKLAFAPRLDVGAGYNRLSEINLPPFRLSESDLPIPSPFQPILNQKSLTANVSLPVTDIFLTVIPTYKATKKLKQVAALQREAAMLQLSYDARVTFYEYARALGAAAVARASVRVREAGVRDLDSLVQAGTATGTELVRAQAELSNARLAETQAEAFVQISAARIESLTGQPVDLARGIGEPFIGIELGDTPSLESVRGEAKSARPELLALHALENARRFLLRAKRGGEYPKLNATGGVFYGSPNPRYVPPTKDWNDTYEAGVRITWSPNDAVYAHVQAQDAETDLRSVYEDRRLFEQAILVESATAVTGHRTASEQIAARTQALEAARRYEADQRALLLAGAATPNDVLLAQRDLLAASLDWVNSFILGRVAQAALLKTQGKTGLAN